LTPSLLFKLTLSGFGLKIHSISIYLKPIGVADYSLSIFTIAAKLLTENCPNFDPHLTLQKLFLYPFKHPFLNLKLITFYLLLSIQIFLTRFMEKNIASFLEVEGILEIFLTNHFLATLCFLSFFIRMKRI
jgi:hypothetical protein